MVGSTRSKLAGKRLEARSNIMRKLLLPVLAVALFGFAVLHVVWAQQVPADPPPPAAPARSPFHNTLAGSGIVEARTENISIGTPLPGVVVEVNVKVGQRVAAGAPLFRVDDRPLRAERSYRLAALQSAQSQLQRLESMPRPEELPASAAKVREARANFEDQEDQYRRSRSLAKVAVGEEELIKRRQATQMAQQQLARAEADYQLLNAGAWEPDKAIARAAVAMAQAQLTQTEIDLERLQVRASVAGEVLQVNVRPGEYVGTPPGQALVVLGDVGTLHVRVDVDEHDISRFLAGAPARAMVKGDAGLEYDLDFVRIEPYVVPKKSLTGAATERVDTRVLQVIFAVRPGPRRLYVGQQLDVFLEAAPAVPSNNCPKPGMDTESIAKSK
jgi:HlyD family secretion protein